MSIQVPYGHCCSFWLRLPTLTPGNLQDPTSLRLPRNYHHSPALCCRFPFILLSLWPNLVSLPTPDTDPPFPSHFLFHSVPFLHLPLMTVLFPLLSEIQASLLVSFFLFSFFTQLGWLCSFMGIHLSGLLWFLYVLVIVCTGRHLARMVLVW